MSAAPPVPPRRSRIREMRARALDVRREWTASGLVVLSAALPFGVGSFFGVLPHDQPLEPRAAIVLALASSIALAAWCVQREDLGRARLAPLALLALPLCHLVFPFAPVAVALDAALFIAVTTFVGLRAPTRFLVRHHSSNVQRRFLAFAALILLVPGPLFTVSYGLAAGAIVPALTRLLHPPPGPVGEERRADFESVDGLTLAATYWPGRPHAPAVVIVHGLHDGRDRVIDWARALNQRGAHVLAYDQRGHGISGGALITFADREPQDVLRATDTLLALSGAAPEEVRLLGISMGGGAVLRALPALEERGIHRAVLLAPASDYDALVSRALPPRPFLGPARAIVLGVCHALGYRAPLELIPRDALDEAPLAELLVFHGTADLTILPELTERMAREHPTITVRWLENEGHNEIARDVLAAPEWRSEAMAWLGLPPS